MDAISEQADRYAEFLSVLQHRGKLSATDLNKVQRMQQSSMSDSIPQLLIKLGLCSENDIAESFVQSCQIVKIEATQYPLETPFKEDIPLRFLKHNHAIGLKSDENAISVAVMDPLDQYIVQALKLATEKNIQIQIGLLSEINAALEIQYGDGKSQMDQLVDHLETGEIGSE
ncbi:MAG: type II secretion system protein GspE, partial [Methylococcales bacterium]|nr:type II secretion system protein GspE [Methylococcales bacterium]